jgi:hypothetical protein
MRHRTTSILPRSLVALTLSMGLSGTLATAPLQSQEIPPEPAVIAPVLSGLGLGAVGFFGGALVGAGLSEGCDGYYCELGSAALAALIGESVGMGIGVHLGNRRRGSLGLDILTAAGSATGALIVLNAVEDDEGDLLLLALVLQTTATVTVERTTGRNRERRAALSVVPTREGAIRIGVEIPLR